MSHKAKREGTHNGNAGRASSLSGNSIPWLVWVGEDGSVLTSALGRLSPAGFAAPWTPAETRPLGGRPYRLARCGPAAPLTLGRFAGRGFGLGHLRSRGDESNTHTFCSVCSASPVFSA